MNNFKGCVPCVCLTGSGRKRSCEEQNINNTFSMFLAYDKITHLHRLHFPGPYDTGKRHLPSHLGASPNLLHWYKHLRLDVIE